MQRRESPIALCKSRIATRATSIGRRATTIVPAASATVHAVVRDGSRCEGDRSGLGRAPVTVYRASYTPLKGSRYADAGDRTARINQPTAPRRRSYGARTE